MSARRPPLALAGLCAAVAVALVLTVPRGASRVALAQQRPVLVDVFPPTPAVSGRGKESRRESQGERERGGGAERVHRAADSRRLAAGCQ
jgi:hypothetical protein